MIASYYQSQHFKGLEASTQAAYRGVIEQMRVKHGHKRVAHMRRKHVLQLLEEKADTPNAANSRLKRLRQLLDHAIDMELRDDNPARGVKAFTIKGDGFHTWTEDEIARYLEVHPKGTVAHTAMILMLYTGAARSDAVKLGKGNIGKDGRLRYKRRKTQHRNAVNVNIPVHEVLADVLAGLSKDNFTFLQTRQGASRSPDGLGNYMREWCDAAGLPECTAHGLRKAISRRLLEAGVSERQAIAITGHKTTRELEPYARELDRARMADDAMAALADTPKGEQTLTNHPLRFVNHNANPLKKKEN